MKEIKFVTGEPRIERGWKENAEITPVYAILNGQKVNLRNIRKPLSGSPQKWLDYEHHKSIDDVEKAKKNLIEHDGKYVTFYAHDDDPFDFLKWVSDNGYTLQGTTKFFRESSSGGYTDFIGNTREYSCAFFYRIYDKKLVHDLVSVVSDMKQIIV